MDPVRLIEIKEDIHADNERVARDMRSQLAEQRTFLVNLMSAPGSGKTQTILRTIEELRGSLEFGVIEADIDSVVDAETMAAHGIRAIQLRTGGFCHLDASMVQRGIDEIGLEGLDVVIIENVGNLVCPAEFDTGALKNVMILSVPEGDDKPLKYPLMFSVCDVLLINVALGLRSRCRPGAGPAAEPEHPDLRDLGQDGCRRQGVGRLAGPRGEALHRGLIPARGVVLSGRPASPRARRAGFRPGSDSP
jgi:hydrogenase nickel incorporation protein HypB